MSIRELHQELQAIASCELGDVLAVLPAWERLTGDQANRLVLYLRAEMGEYGLLSLAHLKDQGQDAEVIRRQARLLLRRLPAVSSEARA